MFCILWQKWSSKKNVPTWTLRKRTLFHAATSQHGAHGIIVMSGSACILPAKYNLGNGVCSMNAMGPWGGAVLMFLQPSVLSLTMIPKHSSLKRAFALLDITSKVWGLSPNICVSLYSSVTQNSMYVTACSGTCPEEYGDVIRCLPALGPKTASFHPQGDSSRCNILRLLIDSIISALSWTTPTPVWSERWRDFPLLDTLPGAWHSACPLSALCAHLLSEGLNTKCIPLQISADRFTCEPRFSWTFLHDSTMPGLTWLRLSQWPDSKPREAGRQKCRLSAWTAGPQLACATKDCLTPWPLSSLSLCPLGPWRRGKAVIICQAAGFSSLVLGHKQGTINCTQTPGLLSLFKVSTGTSLDRSCLHMGTSPWLLLPNHSTESQYVEGSKELSCSVMGLPSSWAVNFQPRIG